MANQYKLFFDLETGGTDWYKNPILTAYFLILDDNYNKIDDLELYLKPSDITNWEIEQEALDVTKINLEEHLNNPRTVVYEEGVNTLIEFLKKHKLPRLKRSFRPYGHNIDFDINFIINQLMPKKQWESLVHYNTLDTLRILTFLQDIGIMPSRLGNLTSLVEHFEITKQVAHDAKNDVEMTVEVYKRLVELVQSGGSNTIDKSILEIIEQ